MDNNVNSERLDLPSESGHETTDANPLAITLMGTVIVLTVVASLFVARWMFSESVILVKQSGRPVSAVSTSQAFSGPRLQSQPAVDLAELRSDDDRRLSTYGWIDPDRKIIRIPIHQAIKILSERGLPEPQQSIKTGETRGTKQ